MERVRACRGHSGAVSFVAATIGLALLAAGCGASRGDPRPALLLDGSAAPSLPAPLLDLRRGAVVSRFRVLRATEVDARGRACLDGFRSEFEISPRATVVERIGVVAASLTVLDRTRRVVLGCDRTARTTAGRIWCARSVGRLVSGRLRDPRVDILCRGPRGDPVGLGWIEPAAGVRWVLVQNDHAAEVEEVAGGLPVRVATAGVSIASSSATFVVTEYRSDGKEVRRYRLRAGVAG
jgi:hypothetical protein